MEYGEHDGPGASSAWAFRRPGPANADGVRYADSGLLPDRTLPAGDGRPDGGTCSRGGGHVPADGRFPRVAWYPDADTGTYPVLDWHAGYERYAGDRSARPGAPAGERPLTRPYAGPADPRQARPADDAIEPPLTARLSRLRPDRWILAGGSLAAAVAVVVAFATAGGSTAPVPAKAGQPACVSLAPGH